MRLVVMDRDVFGSDDFEGEVQIPLTDLMDQMKHDIWLDLKGQGSAQSNKNHG